MAAGPKIAHIVACAAPPVLELAALLDLVEERGWSPCVILTPTAADWVDVAALEARTGRPVRSAPRRPGEDDPFPAPDAVIAAPLTFNTLNKWAWGAGDTFALGHLNRALGLGVPVVAAPMVSPALRHHPAYATSLATLAGAGVALLDPDAVTFRRPDGSVTADWGPVAGALEVVQRGDVAAEGEQGGHGQ
ncbi:hypothetical protein Afil01_03520 [Actinorhabdospora filicis]|uniref:Flavoprotein domain-containing protein n=1 Tax=Actinorhabdospora filicis TaxID=1785913 RepID=A0A9W6W8D2_9ACTN|nr:flavoprotein [Actinorhabdospora filicis]GLZ75545.1 hypothetical protein Afil01_03520 [Actinorhabdospora filicis]